MEQDAPHGRLGMLDEHGHRQFIIPAEVTGFYSKTKAKVHSVLICFFLALPWIHINGHQLVLFNVPARRFHLFGLQLLAHDAPLIFFLLISFAVGLALATALFGRVWCGWACPQTVFIEALYRRIERWSEGNYITRRNLQLEPMTFTKFRKVSLKWLLYLLVSSLIAHSFIAYFTGSKELVEMIQGPPRENFSYFVMVTFATLALLFNFGWFREQFCVIMCPYGKFQSVLMDQQTLTVMYDQDRGEPRKGVAIANDKRGDCVSCLRCVQVCPTKIDIRNGVQLECIACTACIDACDEIMAKLKKPLGLIRYKALSHRPINWFRSRILLYSSILIAAVIGFSLVLIFSDSLRVEFLRVKSNPYLVRTEGSEVLIENPFILRLENNGHTSILKIETDPEVKVVTPENPLTIEGEKKRDVPVFFEIPAHRLSNGRLQVNVTVKDENHKVHSTRSIILLGPVLH